MDSDKMTAKTRAENPKRVEKNQKIKKTNKEKKKEEKRKSHKKEEGVQERKLEEKKEEEDMTQPMPNVKKRNQRKENIQISQSFDTISI